MKILIGSGNKNKIKEIIAIAANSYPDIILDNISNMKIPDPHEPYNTFMENAKLKAKYYANITKMPVLSEDAGICVNALDDFPGVRTKRFVQEVGSFENAFDILRDRLKGIDDYSAKFVCSAAVYFPDQGKYLTFEGVDEGRLAFPARGCEGFGFDPIFIPDGFDKTYSELGPLVKRKNSHRALAMNGIFKLLKL